MWELPAELVMMIGRHMYLRVVLSIASVQRNRLEIKSTIEIDSGDNVSENIDVNNLLKAKISSRSKRILTAESAQCR
jgi:hypothetical protein